METCIMIEDGPEIFCSECGVRMKDEIYYMFVNSKHDFQYCPHCGRKIIEE
jgi:predicted  nucleic acid-binding Zn-ribbon protein